MGWCRFGGGGFRLGELGVDGLVYVVEGAAEGEEGIAEFLPQGFGVFSCAVGEEVVQFIDWLEGCAVKFFDVDVFVSGGEEGCQGFASEFGGVVIGYASVLSLDNAKRGFVDFDAVDCNVEQFCAGIIGDFNCGGFAWCRHSAFSFIRFCAALCGGSGFPLGDF